MADVKVPTCHTDVIVTRVFIDVPMLGLLLTVESDTHRVASTPVRPSFESTENCRVAKSQPITVTDDVPELATFVGIG